MRLQQEISIVLLPCGDAMRLSDWSIEAMALWNGNCGNRKYNPFWHSFLFLSIVSVLHGAPICRGTDTCNVDDSLSWLSDLRLWNPGEWNPVFLEATWWIQWQKTKWVFAGKYVCIFVLVCLLASYVPCPCAMVVEVFISLALSGKSYCAYQSCFVNWICEF